MDTAKSIDESNDNFKKLNEKMENLCSKSDDLSNNFTNLSADLSILKILMDKSNVKLKKLVGEANLKVDRLKANFRESSINQEQQNVWCG